METIALLGQDVPSSPETIYAVVVATLALFGTIANSVVQWLITRDKLRYDVEMKKLQWEVEQCREREKERHVWEQQTTDSVEELKKTALVGRVLARKDKEGVLRIIEANKAMTLIFGWTQAELVGMEPAMLVHPADRDRHREASSSAINGKMPSERRVTINGGRGVKKDGTVIACTVEVQIVADHGEPAISAAITQD